jgi:hypothetical protein
MRVRITRTVREERGEIHVRLRRRVRRVSKHDRLTRRKCVRGCVGTWNHDIEHHTRWKMGAHVLRHPLTRRIIALVHREEDPVERELLVGCHDVLNAPQDLRRRLEREWLALQRHDDVLARLENLVHDRSEARRRVDDDHMTPLACRMKQLLEQVRFGYKRVIGPMIRGVAHGTRQHDAQPRQGSREDDLAKPPRTVQIIGEPVRRVPTLETDAVANRALRIDVHYERLESTSRERRGEVDGCRRLPNTTFLTNDREHVPHRYGSVSSRVAPGSVPERRSSSVCFACFTQRSDSAPPGGCLRNASRCCMAPSPSPRLSNRNASP